jgi:MraZ protein
VVINAILLHNNKVYNLLGEYEVTVDAKGRFLMPGALRKQLPKGEGEKFVVNRGFENCLSVYPVHAWEILSAQINKLNDFNPKVREFKRLFLNGATIVELDGAGRMLLPKSLGAYANLIKDVTVCAQGNKMELWNTKVYMQYINERASDFSGLAAEVAGGDFFNSLNAPSA